MIIWRRDDLKENNFPDPHSEPTSTLLLSVLIILLILVISPEEVSASEPEVTTAASGTETFDIATLEQELLAIKTELMILEEDLLYPASSRVAVYVSMDVGEFFKLDAVSLKLNGEEVTHHLYTERQVNALYRGGVQRLYVGNARQGKNELTAFFIGEGPHERDYKRGTTIKFEHSFEPVYVELSINDVTADQQPAFSAEVH